MEQPFSVVSLLKLASIFQWPLKRERKRERERSNLQKPYLILFLSHKTIYISAQLSVKEIDRQTERQTDKGREERTSAATEVTKLLVNSLGNGAFITLLLLISNLKAGKDQLKYSRGMFFGYCFIIQNIKNVFVKFVEFNK